jgi:large subunit ribosomal protein L13
MYLSPIIMTPFIKDKDIKKDWYLINAQDAAVGRLAAFISKVLRGKNKPTYNPHIDNGDFVVVTNIEKIKFSGKKFKNKKYYRHTGHPGGIKETTPLTLKEKSKTQDILRLAVKRMLPSGPLGKKQLTKLKIYSGETHPHDVQKPKIINFEKLNKKNTLR